MYQLDEVIGYENKNHYYDDVSNKESIKPPPSHFIDNRGYLPFKDSREDILNTVQRKFDDTLAQESEEEVARLKSARVDSYSVINAVQMVNWTGDVNLAALDLRTITASKLIYDADEDGGVWRITIGGQNYIMKCSSEDSGQEIFATTLAGVLGANSPTIAQKVVSVSEAASMANSLEEGDCDFPGSGASVILMQDLGGKNLIDMKEEEGRILIPEDYIRMGEMAVMDLVIGIGDRFEMAGDTANVNFCNIVLGIDGEVHPIDFDIGQSGVVEDSTPFDQFLQGAVKSQGQTLVNLVYDALTSDDDRGMEHMVIQQQGRIKKFVAQGVAAALSRLKLMSLELMTEIALRGDSLVDEGYGTGVVKRIKALASILD